MEGAGHLLAQERPQILVDVGLAGEAAEAADLVRTEMRLRSERRGRTVAVLPGALPLLDRQCFELVTGCPTTTRVVLARGAVRCPERLDLIPDRIDVPALERNGWKHYHDADTLNPALNFEAYPWATFLWAYRHTGEREFLEKARTAK